MKKAEERSTKMLPCGHCPKEFRYNSERKRHELSHFPRFECETCSKKFSFISALRRHQKQHERTGSVKCEECNRRFRDDVLLKRHIKYAHKDSSIFCEKCNSKFSSDLALRTHMMTHRPESERRFKCSHKGCTKSFNFSHHLKHHELTHTNDKQHYCSFCGKGFIQSHHLKTHMKAHDPSGWMICESPGCKKKFSTDYARKRHMAVHKNKPDSGISSDSNSCDASISSKDYTEESILCANCGETISQNEYQKHSEKCNNEEKSISFQENSQMVVEEWPNSPFKPNAFKDTSTKSVIERDMGDCDIMLGGCIVNSDCICAQMAKPVSEDSNFTPIDSNMNDVNTENSNINVEASRNPANLLCHENSNRVIVNDPKPVTVKVGSVSDYKQNNQLDMCEGCNCANICNAKVSMYDITPHSVDLSAKIVKKDCAAPNIEYRIDGVIKIKDTFDDDIVVKTEKNDLKSKRFIPFSTCKDVIGNCLVSGGDGCLCARMMADEDQAIMAQEIDDITPQPKTEPL